MSNPMQFKKPTLVDAPLSESRPSTAAGPPLLDNPLASEFFSSLCCGFSLVQGTITLTFETTRCDHTSPGGTMVRLIVGRVTMPILGAQALALDLNNCLNRSGFSPSHAATEGMVAQ